MQNDDFNIDVVIAEITAFAENMHAKNQHKKKVCLRCMMIIPLVFMVLMFTMDTAKVVYLLLWVISLFILAPQIPDLLFEFCFHPEFQEALSS